MMNSGAKYVQIILPLNLKGTFTYKVSEELVSKISMGMRVLVSFGGRKIYTGIVFEIHGNKPESFEPKEIISLLDDKPILPEPQLKFWKWFSDYYLCNLGEIYRMSFPGSLKLESETYLKLKSNVTVDFQNLDSNEMLLVQALELKQLISLSEIEAFISKKDIIKTINSLIDLQYIEIDEKISEKYKTKEIAYIRIKDFDSVQNKIPEILLSLKRSAKQKELFLKLLELQSENPSMDFRKSQVLSDNNFASSHCKGLLERGLVEEYYLQENRLQSYSGDLEELDNLTPLQSKAVNDIDKAFEEGKKVLLHGVTSSGKTHIYLEKIEDAVSKGGNVLFLMPEVSLTKQMIQRLEKKFGDKLGFYHQKLTDFERVEVWKKIKKNEIRILIGTRISLFLPYENLDLVVVDEEHDAMYRSFDSGPFYNGKDASLVLAEFYKSKVILGSATPSVESYFLAQKDKLRYVSLESRYGEVAMPKFEIQDFKEAQNAKLIHGNFTQNTLLEIKTHVDAKKQVMILHNRRGYANVIECQNCGHVSYCSNCDVVMTYHKSSNELKCHYCSHKSAKPTCCAKCKSLQLQAKGIGVEQIFEEVTLLFPNSEVERMDVDSMRKKFAYEILYEKIESGKTNIVVGTQMISKGLDFENMELMVVPRVDHMLYVQDFRAEERVYQLLTQLSGRAGRTSGNGKVIIQTYHPEHDLFSRIQSSDSSEIYGYLLGERKKFHYPPFTKLILIELKHRREEKVDRASQYLSSILLTYLPQEYVLGPSKSPISKVNLMYQYQILLKLPRGKSYNTCKSLLMKSIQEFQEITAYQSVKIHLYVDF